MEFASYNTVYSVQQIVVVAFEFTSVAREFMINILCGPQGQKVEKHFSSESSVMGILSSYLFF